MKLYIISNRLPVKVTGEAGAFVFSRSEGGLATGLDSLNTAYEKAEIGSQLEKLNFHPVFLTDSQITNYYEGYSNSTIWPLCHYFYVYTLYRNSFWQAYQEVNRRFCEEICRLIQPDDKIWVQDYQLMLLPGMLREAMPHLCIGYFHHSPLTSSSAFYLSGQKYCRVF